MSKENLSFWDSVEKTDPKYTTKVNQRGGFTAIAAQSQVKMATEQFGMFGTGWGVTDERFSMKESVGLAIYQATLWYNINDVEGSFPIHSSIRFMNDKGYVDDDFAKKVATDALTKGLSKLGFNADVFMGLFDDNKYVNQLRSEFSTKKEQKMEINWRSILLDASKKLDDKDSIQILEMIDDGRINEKNWAKSLERIKEMNK